MSAPQKITIDVAKLEAIIGEAICLAAWGGNLPCASLLWGGQPATQAGIVRAMSKALAVAEVEC